MKKMNTQLLIMQILFFSLSLSFKDIKGINFVSVPYTRVRYTDSSVNDSLIHLKSTGATHISIPVTLFQDQLDSSEMYPIYKEVATL